MNDIRICHHNFYRNDRSSFTIEHGIRIFYYWNAYFTTFIPYAYSVPKNIVLSICLSTMMIFGIEDEVDKVLLLQLIKGSFFGLIFGICLYLFLHIYILKMYIGILTIFVTILLLLKWTLKRTKKRDFIVDGISGFLTTSFGVPGPPLLVYFSGAKMDKETLRSTTLA